MGHIPSAFPRSSAAQASADRRGLPLGGQSVREAGVTHPLSNTSFYVGRQEADRVHHRGMGSLLAHASSEQALLDAWEDLRSAAQEDGPTSPEILDFESHAARRIHAISVQLRAGTWQPSPAHHVAIAKAAGGVRHLAVPPVEDRVVERAILNVLDPVIDPLLMPWTYGYRRGLGVDDAIRALIEARDSGYSCVLRADIQDCFAQIPRWPVIVRLREVCPDPELVEVVRSVIRRHVVGKDSPHATGGRGLHQGSPLAPLLANIYLDGFDREMASRGWQVIRFSDDFAVPARDRAAAERCVGDAIAAAQAVNLQLNLGKTHSVSFDEGVAFLGRLDPNPR
ncbi:MAG: hypothetical protein QG597_3822 [Actinomycetota bacterium]|nr:hypothetical protein [Actinomycetota bacterium]